MRAIVRLLLSSFLPLLFRLHDLITAHIFSYAHFCMFEHLLNHDIKLVYGTCEICCLFAYLVANGTIVCQGAAFELPNNGKYFIYLHIQVLIANMPFLLPRSRIFNLLQVILRSEVKARLHVKDIWLDLQSGFEHIGKGDGRPSSNLFPLVIAPSSRAGILFIIRLSGTTGKAI
jgi:hypothetical protein